MENFLKNNVDLRDQYLTNNLSSSSVEDLIEKNGSHKVFELLNSKKNLQIFSSIHCFCVYDFMFLAKSLQHVIAPSGPTWRGNIISSTATRAINEIILEEESDVNPDGGFISHHDLYLQGMDEIGADKKPLLHYVRSRNSGDLAPAISDFVSYHTDLAKSMDPMKIAGAFFYGRESLLPKVFQSIVDVLGERLAPTLRYYFERHIELDGRNHSELGEQIIYEISSKLGVSQDVAVTAGVESLIRRHNLFDYAYEMILQKAVS